MNAWWEPEESRWRRAALAPLAPLSWAYAAAAGAHRALTRPVRVPVPVISVGNLAVGGQGKTPVALEIARRLSLRGLRPAILSRGYGGALRAPVVEATAESDPGEVGDEPALLARQGARVWVAKRRVLAAQAAIAAGAGVLVLDDGLQHAGLARELDVVVLDASNPLGNGRLLPRGPLRERPAALGRRPHRLAWLTRCELPRDPRTDALRRGEPAVESRYEPRPRQPLAGARALLVAGIGRPEGFLATAVEARVEVLGHRWFRDHHRWSARALSALKAEAAGLGASLVLTTEKDAMRLPPWAFEEPVPFVALPIELRLLAGEESLEAALSAALERGR